MLHEDMMCLVPVAAAEHQSLFKAPEQAEGALGLVCYTCFCDFTIPGCIWVLFRHL